MKNFIIACFLSFIILTAIYESNHKPGNTSEISSIYATAQDTLTIDTNKFILETYLCRSAVESTPETRNDLVALIYLVNTGNLQIFTNMSLVNLHIIRNNYKWSSNPGSSHSNSSRFNLARVSNDGPGLDTGIYVDVIADIRIDSVVYSVIARHQTFEGLK